MPKSSSREKEGPVYGYDTSFIDKAYDDTNCPWFAAMCHLGGLLLRTIL
jgi:hypothetical protein